MIMILLVMVIFVLMMIVGGAGVCKSVSLGAAEPLHQLVQLRLQQLQLRFCSSF